MIDAEFKPLISILKKECAQYDLLAQTLKRKDILEEKKQLAGGLLDEEDKHKLSSIDDSDNHIWSTILGEAYFPLQMPFNADMSGKLICSIQKLLFYCILFVINI